MSRHISQGYYALRWKIFERDNFTCQYCGQYAPNIRLEIDHVIPLEDDGTDDPSNLKTCCWACNHGKSGLRIQQTRWKARRQVNGIPIRYHPRQVELYELIKEQPGLRSDQVAKLLNISHASAGMAFLRLKRRGLVYKIGLAGSRKNTHNGQWFASDEVK